MFTINSQSIDDIARREDSKIKPGKEFDVLYDSFKKIVWNNIEVTSEFSEYQMSHWINNIDRWINNISATNNITYKRSSIVNIDLGAINFRYEP